MIKGNLWLNFSNTVLTFFIVTIEKGVEWDMWFRHWSDIKFVLRVSFSYLLMDSTPGFLLIIEYLEMEDSIKHCVKNIPEKKYSTKAFTPCCI